MFSSESKSQECYKSIWMIVLTVNSALTIAEDRIESII